MTIRNKRKRNDQVPGGILNQHADTCVWLEAVLREYVPERFQIVERIGRRLQFEYCPGCGTGAQVRLDSSRSRLLISSK